MAVNRYCYFLLDENHVPVQTTKSIWEKEIKGKRHLAVDKYLHKKIVTSFVSKHEAAPSGNPGGPSAPTQFRPMFKTKVYDCRGSSIYICYYDDYDSAMKGHKRTMKERSWEAR